MGDIFFDVEEKNGYYFVKIWVKHGQNPQNKYFYWILKYKDNETDEDIYINCTEKKHKVKYKNMEFEVILDENLRKKSLINVLDTSKNKGKTLKIEKCIYKIEDLQI